MSLPTPEPWKTLRRDTPGCVRVAHFNNAGAALMPQPVIDAMKRQIDLEASIGGYEAKRERADDITQIYEDIAALIGAEAKNVALTANATDAYARALSSIPFTRGDVIVAAWSEYASNQIQLLSLAKRLGVKLVRVPLGDGGQTDLNALDDLIRKHKPKLVASVHVNTSSGAVEDVAAIGAVCSKHETLYLVDGCQSFGQMPIDVAAIGCDFFSATSRKFLRGPRGAGLLYVSDRVLDQGLEPMFLDLNGALLIDAERYDPVTDAKRFEDWEFSYAVLFGFGAAARYALDIGLDRIEARLAEVNAVVRGAVTDISGWRVIDRGARLCPIIPAWAEGIDGAATQAALSAAGVNTTYVPTAWAPMDEGLAEAGWAIRISPHYYTDAADIGRLVDGLSAAVRR